jgi:GntP family gluconate:H+ symporter
MTTAVLVLVAIVCVILLTSRFKFNAFFALVLVALALALATNSLDKVVPTLKTGFGNTLMAIGLIILFGTTIGVVLDKTGATYAMAHYILGLTGKDKAARAIAITGFMAGLPIFCDSGFIVLSGLNKSLSRASGVSIVRMAGSLAIALYTLHCLIPPHPGITAAAGIMNGSLGNLVLLGVVIALPAAVVGYVWIKIMSARFGADEDAGKEPEDLSTRKLPGTLPSFLPVVLPLLMIMFSSFMALIPGALPPSVMPVVQFLGDPVIALLVGVALALMLVPRENFGKINDMFAEAIDKAGPILAITAAGGAFGAVIKATGIGDQVSGLVSGSNLGLIVPFALAAILKTAQGSSTVAAITSASIIASMLAPLGLDSDMGRTLALLSIGAGSMMVSHANDSYFWVVTKFSDISPNSTLKVYSTATVAVSLTSFSIIWVLSFVLR